MTKAETKNFSSPDEVRTPTNTKVDIVKLGNKSVLRMTFQPGWKWSDDIKPGAGTDTCQAHHFGYQISGHVHVTWDDGTEIDIGPGDVADIPPGHDAWVVGSEPAVMVDFGDAAHYAEKQ